MVVTIDDDGAEESPVPLSRPPASFCSIPREDLTGLREKLQHVDAELRKSTEKRQNTPNRNATSI